MDFKIGQVVRVANTGKCYSTYTNIFKKSKEPFDFASRYAYRTSLSEIQDVKSKDFVLLDILTHDDEYTTVAIIEEKAFAGYGRVFVIGIDGLAECMTRAEAEKKFGVKIVD